MTSSRTAPLLLLAVTIGLAVPGRASAQAPSHDGLATLLTQPSMNVFRRFTVDRAKMIEFYGDLLALKPLPPIGMPGGSQMTRFQVGTSEIKLTELRRGVRTNPARSAM